MKCWFLKTLVIWYIMVELTKAWFYLYLYINIYIFLKKHEHFIFIMKVKLLKWTTGFGMLCTEFFLDKTKSGFVKTSVGHMQAFLLKGLRFWWQMQASEPDLVVWFEFHEYSFKCKLTWPLVWTGMYRIQMIKIFPA